ncbi:MAG: peptidylprolyl isomerase [Pseudomonadota bacterium]
MNALRRLWREPLVHFLLIGALIFVALDLTGGGEEEAPPNEIRITEALRDRLAANFQAVWQRPATDEEMEALVEAHIREEILVREALALGLDSGDPVIRQRLTQKLAFLTSSMAASTTPDDETLTAFFEENSELYTLPARLSVDHVYLGETPSAEAVGAALEALEAGALPAEVGQPTRLPARVADATVYYVDRVFGEGMFATLEEVPEGVWHGPVQSGFGLHIVRVTDRRGATLPPLDAARDSVIADWRQEQAEGLRNAAYEKLRAQYAVVEDGE